MRRFEPCIREFGETGYQYTADMRESEKGEWVKRSDLFPPNPAKDGGGYWEGDKTWVEPVPGTGPMAKCEAWVVKITHTGKLCHYADGRIAFYDEPAARDLVEYKIEHGIPATAEKVEILVVPLEGE